MHQSNPIMRFMIDYQSLLLLALACLCCEVQAQRSDPQQRINRPVQQKQQKQASQGNITNCGTVDDLVIRVENCAAPLVDIIQGTIEKWPRTEADVGDLCQSYFGSERCIRDNSRKCAKGLQKTVISTLANSIQRVRKRECSPQKLAPWLKTMNCIENNHKAIGVMVANATSHLVHIDSQMKDLDKKTTAVCCMIADVETSLRETLRPFCPAEAEATVRLYRAILEDVTDLVCRSPKCNNIFAGQNVKQNTKPVGIIAILLKIVFSLGE